MALTVTNADTTYETTTSDPSSYIPEGTTVYTEPKGIGIGGVANEKVSRDTGVAISGTATESGESAQATAYLYLGGSPVTSYTVTNSTYGGSVLPPKVYEGSTSLPRGSSYILLATESGGTATKNLTGSSTVFDASFNAIDIEILNADGEGVPSDPVYIDGISQTTADSGVLRTSSSGTVTISALGQSVSDDVDVSITDNISFQYARVTGSVKTMSGDPIANKNVDLLNSSGEVIDTTTTDESGSYEFSKAPVNSTLYVKAEPYFRKTASGDQGTATTVNFPAPILNKGSVGDSVSISEDELVNQKIKFIDSHTGSPIQSLSVRVGDWVSETGSTGIIDAILEASNGDQIEFDVTGNSRYQGFKESIVLDDSKVYEVEIDREINTSQK
jgi:hypothetical protein